MIAGQVGPAGASGAAGSAAAGSTTTGVPLGWSLVVHGTVGSTQAEARTRLEAGEGRTVWPDGALAVSATAQSGGRGRHGRTWASPPGNLYLTVAVPCPGGPRRGVDVGFLGGVALVEALRDLGVGQAPGAASPRLKWPNDVLLDGAKVAGLLPESATDPDGRVWVLLGMGVNVATAPPAGAALYPPCALLDRAGETHPTPSVEALRQAVLARLSGWVARWRMPEAAGGGFAPVRAAWLRYGHGLGEPVRVRLGEATVTGVFEGLAPDGALILRDTAPGNGGTGAVRTIRAGDVFFDPAAPGCRGEEA